MIKYTEAENFVITYMKINENREETENSKIKISKSIYSAIILMKIKIIK